MLQELQYRRTFQGAWVISALVRDGIDSFYHDEQYMGYSKIEATRLFMANITKRGWILCD